MVVGLSAQTRGKSNAEMDRRTTRLRRIEIQVRGLREMYREDLSLVAVFSG